jgi:hypothetical protein
MEEAIAFIAAIAGLPLTARDEDFTPPRQCAEDGRETAGEAGDGHSSLAHGVQGAYP